jgi:small-conductance mechanosensitive channel
LESSEPGADARWIDAHGIDLLSTVLLTLAAVATAWASYQAAHWRSEQGLAGNRSISARVQANKTAGEANRQIQIDVATYIQWVDAYQQRDEELATFYYQRFRPEFIPAVNAWIATKPLKNPGAPLTPFAMPQYQSAAVAATEDLERKADAESLRAQAYVQRADRYTLCVVMFALALFFAGISTRIRVTSSRLVALGIGWAAFLGAVVWMATFPASLSL